MERAMDDDEILNEIQRLMGFYPKLAEEILVCAITLHFTAAPPSDKWLVPSKRSDAGWQRHTWSTDDRQI